MSAAETLMAAQLEQAGIPFEREYRFAPEAWALAHGFTTPTGLPKRWRADFYIEDFVNLLIEVDGGGFVAGRHSRGSGIEKDAEKQSAAAILGYRVIRCTPRQVDDGTALRWVQQALGMEVPRVA